MLGNGLQITKGNVKRFPLDPYKSQLQFVYSQEKLLTCGCPWCEVIETGGSTTQEFAFEDQAGILAFCGANSGYISGYYDQVTGLRTDVPVGQRQQVVNGGVWVPYTNKYNLHIPQNTSLTMTPAAVVNRLRNLNMYTYIGFKGSVTVPTYTADYVNIFKCLVGVMDFGITNGSNIMWYDADGNVSTLAKPAPNLVHAGNSYMFATNMLAANITIAANTTGVRYVGDVRDFARLTGSLNISSTKVAGDIAYLPRVLNILQIGGCNLLTGNVANMPKPTNSLYAQNIPNLTGNIAFLGPVSVILRVDGCSQLTGAYMPANGIMYIYCNGTNMSASSTDDTIINTAAVTHSANGTLSHKNNRTPASDAARNHLIGDGWTFIAV
jgi:hypothetical protein